MSSPSWPCSLVNQYVVNCSCPSWLSSWSYCPASWVSSCSSSSRDSSVCIHLYEVSTINELYFLSPSSLTLELDFRLEQSVEDFVVYILQFFSWRIVVSTLCLLCYSFDSSDSPDLTDSFGVELLIVSNSSDGLSNTNCRPTFSTPESLQK